MKRTVNAGLNGLLNPNPTTVQEQNEKPTTGKKTANKPVCYTIPTELDDALHYIAYYDRKKINELVTEVLTKYAKGWKPIPQAEPKNIEL